MRDGDQTHRGEAPLPVDLAGHFKEIGRALLPALIIAVIVGGAVFGGLALFAPKEYAATIFTQITPATTPTPGDAYVEEMRAPFMGLATDANVLNQVLAQTDTGWDADTLREHVTLSPGPSPQLLVFTVDAPSPQQARELVEAMVSTVTQASEANFTRDVNKQLEQVRATISAEEASTANLAPDDPARQASDRRLADLRTQLDTLQRSGGDRLSVLAIPTQDLHQVKPQPIPESLVAGLAAFIVAAEAIVIVRGRVGSKPNRTWARRVAHRYRAGFDPARSAQLPDLAAAEIVRQTREGHEVLVLVGEHAVFHRTAALPERANGHGHRRTLSERPLDNRWWQDLDSDAIGVALVIVTTQSGDRKRAEQSLRELAALQVPRWLILQDSKRAALPAPAPAETPAPVSNGERRAPAVPDEPRPGVTRNVQ